MTLIPSTRGRITDAIPAVVIQNICEELEHVSWEGGQPETPPTLNIALERHLKNRDIRAISHVCKSWRSHATAFMCLWRDIAFDVTEPKTIRLAASFLSIVENEDVLLRIYAGFWHAYLPDPDLATLLNGLRRNTHRWVVFEYQGALGEYHSYLDLPAPNLRYFSDHGDSSQDIHQLFAGYTPSLRYLSAWSTRSWDSTILSNLAEFHFSRSGCGPPPSLNSLLGLLRNTPGLETLRLEWLESFIHDCAADTTVSLPRLRILHAYNADFDLLVQHISTPNVLETRFTADTPVHPSFRAPHALAGLSSLPILDQPISEITVVVARTRDEGTFRVHLMMPGRRSFDLCLIWGAGIMQGWKEYVTETLSVLTGRIRLDPDAILRLYLGTRPSRRSSPEGALKIHGGFGRGFFRVMAGAEIPVISPPLTRHLLITNDPPALDEDETRLFRLFLRSRAICKAKLSIRIRHGRSPWLCATDFECSDECKYALQALISISDPYHRWWLPPIP